MRCILIILDGLGDRAYEALGGKTPLQAAYTPNLDRLAALGANGLLHSQTNGRALPSENAHFYLFGYEESEFPGRGYLEAIGGDINLAPEDVAILARLVYASEAGDTLVLENNWPEISRKEAEELLTAISPFSINNYLFNFIRTSGAQGIITIKGGGSRYITDSNPIKEGQQIIEPQAWKEKEMEPATQQTARALGDYLRWCYEQLKRHPVNLARRDSGLQPLNTLITNRAGQYKDIQPFNERWGLKALSISSGIIYHGLCRYLGMDVLAVKDTGRPGDDLAQRLNRAISNIVKYDFIHVHTKTPDEASHQKNPVEKKNIIEKLDRGLGQVLSKLIEDPENLLIITADHSTPCSEPLIHSGEPVPITAWSRGMRRDNISRFNEIDCAGGALGFIYGRDFMYFVLNALDRIKLSGLMDTPYDQAYWPGQTLPFRIR